MTPEELQAFEKAYQEASQGSCTPDVVLTPEGAFVRTADGTVVFDYDDKGNLYGLTFEEQYKRFEAVKGTLGIT